MKQTIILVRGVPGSGKSFISRALQAEIGADSAIVLDPDAIDVNADDYLTLSRSLAEQGVDQKFHAFRYLRAQAYQAIEDGKTVIWNQAFNNFDGFKITVDRLLEYATSHGKDLPVLVVEVEIEKDIARARIADRVAGGGHDVDDESLDRFFDGYESFAGKGYRTITVDGGGNIEQAVQNIIAAA